MMAAVNYRFFKRSRQMKKRFRIRVNPSFGNFGLSAQWEFVRPILLYSLFISITPLSALLPKTAFHHYNCDNFLSVNFSH